MREPNTLELITRYLDGSITDADFAALNAALADDTDLRRHFIGLTYTAQLMAENLNPQFAERRVQGSGFRVQEKQVPHAAFRVPSLIAAAALIALAVTAWFVFLPEPRTPNPEPSHASHAIATLTAADEHVVWTSAPLHPGQDIAAQAIAIESGSAEFMLTSGASVAVQGPAQLMIHDPMRATLVRGIATFDCPPQAVGYTVDLPGGRRIVDLGTRFRVSVQDADHMQVMVLAGHVRLEHGPSRELAAGWTGRLVGGVLTTVPNGQLIDPGFEANYRPTGTGQVTVVDIGRWAGDPATILSADRGITPAEGLQMLRFDATHIEPEQRTTRSAQVYQVVDLTAMSQPIDEGHVVAEVSAAFNRLAASPSSDSVFGIRMVGLSTPDGDAFPNAAGNRGADRAMVELSTDRDPATWQRLDARLNLPAGTRYLLIEFTAVEDKINDSNSPEFDGHFVDDTRLIVHSETPVTSSNRIPREKNASPN